MAIGVKGDEFLFRRNNSHRAGLSNSTSEECGDLNRERNDVADRLGEIID